MARERRAESFDRRQLNFRQRHRSFRRIDFRERTKTRGHGERGRYDRGDRERGRSYRDTRAYGDVRAEASEERKKKGKRGKRRSSSSLREASRGSKRNGGRERGKEGGGGPAPEDRGDRGDPAHPEGEPPPPSARGRLRRVARQLENSYSLAIRYASIISGRARRYPMSALGLSAIQYGVHAWD